jgi:hypothetical protein
MANYKRQEKAPKIRMTRARLFISPQKYTGISIQKYTILI